MPIAVDRSAVRPYTLEGDTTGTLFHLRILDRPLRNMLVKRMTNKKEVEDLDIMQYFEQVVKFGVAGWENFNKADGTPIQYETKEYTTVIGKRPGVRDELLDYFAKEWVSELATAILNENQVTGEAEKNSEPPSASS